MPERYCTCAHTKEGRRFGYISRADPRCAVHAEVMRRERQTPHPSSRPAIIAGEYCTTPVHGTLKVDGSSHTHAYIPYAGFVTALCGRTVVTDRGTQSYDTLCTVDALPITCPRCLTSMPSGVVPPWPLEVLRAQFTA